MKHCSSGREKLFCSHQPGHGKWWQCLGTLGRMGAFPASVRSAEEVSGLKSYPCLDQLHDTGQILTPLCAPVGPSVTEVLGHSVVANARHPASAFSF